MVMCLALLWRLPKLLGRLPIRSAWDIAPEAAESGSMPVALDLKMARRQSSVRWGCAVVEEQAEAISALIRDIGESGRDITDEELQRLRTYLAAVSLARPSVARVDDGAGGLMWEGHILKGGDWMPRLAAKYLKHVMLNREWPDGTTIEEYAESLAEAVQDPTGGVYVERDEDTWKVTCVARSHRWTGRHGAAYIVVAFLPAKDPWLTGFQPDRGLRYITQDQLRTSGRWLRRPR